MKKKWYVWIFLSFAIILAACNSAEADEVLDYHNDFVDYVNPRLDMLLELSEEVISLPNDEDALEMQKNEIIPLVDEIIDYVDAQNPKAEITKEYHEIRTNWIYAISEGIALETEGFEGLLDGTLTEDEAFELLILSEEAITESIRYDEQAITKWEEIKEEYNFEDVEE